MVIFLMRLKRQEGLYMKKPVDDWIFFAESDLAAVERLITDKNPLTNIIAFHCQQAIEKYLKAYLVENGIPIIKTHDLIKLNDMVNKVKDLNIDNKKLLLVKQVYSETRYPGDIGLLPNNFPSVQEVQEYFDFAKEVKTIIINALTTAPPKTP